MGRLMLAAAVLLQADPAGQALHLFTVIRGDDGEDREAARYVLTRMEPSLAPALRKMLPFQKDLVVRSAIREAIPLLFRAWGEELYREGRIDEALICFAEAAGAPDPAKYVRAKVDDAKGFIRRWLPQRRNSFGDLEVDCSKCPGLVRSIQGCFGPWGLAAVLEESRDEEWDFHCRRILEQMGAEAALALRREKSREPQVLPSPGTSAEFPSEAEDLRRQAREWLRRTER